MVKMNNSERRMNYLYAITDWREVKIGISVNVEKRLLELQIGSALPLKIFWTLPAGRDRKIAEDQESKLHRICKRHRKQGEWFEVEVMILVEQFEIKHLTCAGRKRKKKKRKNKKSTG